MKPVHISLPEIPDLKDNIVRLSHARDAQAAIARSPSSLLCSAPMYNGIQRMCLSYVNFYLANGAVIMPE